MSKRKIYTRNECFFLLCLFSSFLVLLLLKKRRRRGDARLSVEKEETQDWEKTILWSKIEPCIEEQGVILSFDALLRFLCHRFYRTFCFPDKVSRGQNEEETVENKRRNDWRETQDPGEKKTEERRQRILCILDKRRQLMATFVSLPSLSSLKEQLVQRFLPCQSLQSSSSKKVTPAVDATPGNLI